MSRPPGLFHVPSIHPARFFRDPTMTFSAIEDWKKAARVQREGPTRVHLPIEEWQWKPTLEVVKRWWGDICEEVAIFEGWSGPWSVDFEATVAGEPICMAVWHCYTPRVRRGLCIPFLSQHGRPYWRPDELKTVFGIVKHFLEDPRILKGGQNVAGYDFGVPPWNRRGLVKRAWNIDVQGIVFDTMVQHWAAFPELRHSLALQASCVTDLPPYKALYHEGEETEADDAPADWARIIDKPDEETRVYCLEDAYATAEAKGSNDEWLTKLDAHRFHEFAIPMVPIVAEIGLRGLPFDTAVQRDLITRLDAHIAKIEYGLSVKGITDPGSSQKLGDQLRAAGVPLSRKTKSGQWATNLEVLGRINFDYNGATDPPPYPFLQDVLDRARLSKLRSMVYGLVPCNDGMLRTALKIVSDIQTNKTNRYTSSGFGRKGKPGFCPVDEEWGEHGTNHQNLPKVQKEHRVLKLYQLRDCIRARPGWELVEADYKQLELRIQGYQLGCRKLIERFEGGADMHTIHGELMFGKGQVFGRRRKLAKNEFYAWRGGGKERAIQIALAKDDEFVDQADIRVWNMALDAEYVEFQRRVFEVTDLIQGMVVRGEPVVCRNAFGRPRLLMGVNPRDVMPTVKDWLADEISSTAAWIMNFVLWRLASRGEPAWKSIVYQGHDAFMLYGPKKIVREHARIVKEEMEKPVWQWDHFVSYPVEVKAGTSWADLKEIEL